MTYCPNWGCCLVFLLLTGQSACSVVSIGRSLVFTRRPPISNARTAARPAGQCVIPAAPDWRTALPSPVRPPVVHSPRMLLCSVGRAGGRSAFGSLINSALCRSLLLFDLADDARPSAAGMADCLMRFHKCGSTASFDRPPARSVHSFLLSSRRSPLSAARNARKFDWPRTRRAPNTNAEPNGRISGGGGSDFRQLPHCDHRICFGRRSRLGGP